MWFSSISAVRSNAARTALSEPSPAVLDGYRTELERLADDDESSVYASKCLDKLDAWADGPSGSETRVYDPDR